MDGIVLKLGFEFDGRWKCIVGFVDDKLFSFV